MPDKLYTVVVECGQPELHGPYADESTRTAYAPDMYDENEDMCIFRLDISEDGTPSVFSFSNRELEIE